MRNYILLVLSISLLSACNFHEVDEDKLYRSAQLSGKEFARAIKKYGIKTVVNLRGESTEDWWLEENEAVIDNGAEHINIRMSAKRLPHREDLLDLMETFENAEYPMLIHCQGGADRTGEAVAMYMMEFMGYTQEKALRHTLTPMTLHLRKFMPAKTYFIEQVYQGWDWVYDHYFPCQNPEWEFYNTENARCLDGDMEEFELEGPDSYELAAEASF